MSLEHLVYSESVGISVNEGFINANLHVPESAKGLVIFAHGSGSSRFSKRNIYVATELNRANFATLLIDLLTDNEEKEDLITKEYRFNIPLLAERLLIASNWAEEYSKTKDLTQGYFGASTGAAAALIAAAKYPEIAAVVSRGGRPDLAEIYLSQVKASVLLIVGGEDFGVIELNQKAYKELNCNKELKIVPGATHLFEEPGTLEEVTNLAKDWFENYLI